MVAPKSPDYLESDEYPIILESQRRYLKMLDSPNSALDDLMDLVGEITYDEAKKFDQRWEQKDLKGVGRMSAVYDKVIEDTHTKYCLPEILRSMPRPIVRSLVENTIGYNYTTDPDFKKLFLESDACAGTYIQTLVVKDAMGKGLNSNEWQRLLNVVERYIAGEGRVIHINSSDEHKQAAQEAAEIEHVYAFKKTRITEVLKTCQKGKRYFMPDKRYRMDLAFCNMIRKRIRLDLDPSGLVRQIQMPCAIGCSEHLNKRSLDYHPAFALQGVTKLWGFMLSCLEFLGIKMEIICLPVIKIWKAEQMNYAEILATLLAHSMADRNGLNVKGPGDKADLNRSVTFEEEKQQIFVRREWAMNNLDLSIEKARSKIEAVDHAKSFWESGADKMINETRAAIELSDTVPQVLAELKDTENRKIEEFEKTKMRLDEDDQKLSSIADTLSAYSAFKNDIGKWLQDEEDEDEILAAD
ncbi:hypothetical protein BELL_0164g00100 [Botrytis elliptica]|uniref:Uncharacterized protein n=1 Tax=Botrytis elliptica TaxID=278938 RepID=A0A4Z1JR65_9HELO|nr:hypothetical protein EAE99_009460 [Botrytis elliptica]TGO76281.1 hypothetical protein BELL_0164g00100 [Botrytis elliptica]